MRMAATLLRKAGYSVTIAAAVAFSTAAPATTLGLSDTPLFLSAGVQPNLIMAIDDSGSMDFEVLFPGNDGSAWWRRGNSGGCLETDIDSFVGCISNAGTGDMYGPNKLNFNNAGNANGTWKKYTYLFPNGAGGGNTTARRRSGDNDNDHFAIPPLPAFAWARSPTYNAAYFNPEATYLPWVNGGGYTFTNATPTATRFDPVFEADRTIDLTRDYAGDDNVDLDTACTNIDNDRSGNYLFRTYEGMTLPENTCFRTIHLVPDGPDRGREPDEEDSGWRSVNDADGCEVGVADGCAVSGPDLTVPDGALMAIRYFPATFWLPANQTLPAEYGFTGTKLTGGKAPDGTAMVGYEIKSRNFSTTDQYNKAIQNFANWFQYYRKRHQALRAGLGNAFQDMSGLFVDGFTINTARSDGQSTQVTMGLIDDQDVRTGLYSRFYYDWVRSGGTPNRSAVAALIDNFKRTDNNAPVTQACQKNFGMLFTDGFSNSPSDNDGISGVYANVDGDQGDPYEDDYSGSLADAVMDAYINPLRDDFDEGKVSVPPGCGTGPYAGGPLDCNRNLHMNFFAITLGTRGLLFNPDDPADPYSSSLTWPSSFPARHPSAVDDLWHATINGRGQLLNARSPQEISDKLKAVLRSIIDRTSTAAAAALNSGSISSDSRIFQARFNSANWSGQLLSYAIDPTNGQLLPASRVDASEKLRSASADSRKIFTRDSAGEPVRFNWADLQADATRVLQLDPNNDPAEAQRMLNYLRGAEVNEGTEDTNYRVRRDSAGHNKLGDIVSSAPLYVAAPPFRYRDSLESAPYSTFAFNNRNRAKMVYVGANDGMLHAFYADGERIGQEAFAYVPGAVFPKLRQLASQTYGHQFYVDGSPSMGDAFFSGDWHTVIAGGLNKGGQAVYAIDVTNPETVTADSMLWEFTDANDADLGFTYSQPVIAKLRDGQWYAIFGNGYNNTFADGRASATGNAVLFLVNIGTGAYIKIDTGIGVNAGQGRPLANGLATPTVVDLNGDRVVEYAYAGDLYGNLWKFDLSSTSSAAWSVAFDGTPLFTARNDAGTLQPITVRPEVVRGPGGNGQLVLFGTGKYLEPSDKLREPEVIQSFYGIIDRNAPVTFADGQGRADILTKQEILREVPVVKQDPAGNDVESEIRITTDNPLGGNTNGWYIDLLSPESFRGYEAEKAVTNPVVRDGKVIFTTLVPDPDPCGFGGTSWLMELDMIDGSRLQFSPFDLNRDGVFDEDDSVTANLNGTETDYPAGGIRSQEGALQSPGVANGEFGEEGKGTPVQYKYLPGSSGNIQIIIENPGAGGTGRQSWRQVR